MKEAALTRERTEHGFYFGPAIVECGFSDEKKGWVVIILTTPKYPNGIQLYVTKTGILRVNGKRFKA